MLTPHPAARGFWTPARLSHEGARLVREIATSNGAAVLAARLAGAALAYAGQVAAARWLGADGFGHYALALVWLTILGHLATFGTPQAVCRHVAAALATGDTPAVRGFVVFGLGVVALTGALVAAAALALLWAFPDVAESAAWRPLALAMLAVPLLAVQDILESLARAFDRPAAGIAPAYVVRHGATLVVFAALLLGAAPGDPAGAVLAAIGGLLLGVAGQSLLVLRLIRRRIPPGPRRYELRRWLGTALPVALVDGTEILLLNMDVLLVGLFLPPPSVAAYYAATRLTQMLDLVRYAASAATAQRFAALFALGRAEDVVRLARRATLATAALCGAGAITLSLLAGPLLGLFGSGFAAAAPVVPIAAAGLVLAALCGPGEDLLTMTGGERVCAAVHAVALPLTLLLALVLIPTLGIVGAALATATALVGRSAALAWLAWRRLGALPVGSGRAG